METKLNRKRLLGHRGQILAWLIVTFVALSLPLAPRAFAQDPNVKFGKVTGFHDSKLELRRGVQTYTFDTTEKTRWLYRGQPIDRANLNPVGGG
jgi:hypothetical protein